MPWLESLRIVRIAAQVIDSHSFGSGGCPSQHVCLVDETRAGITVGHDHGGAQRRRGDGDRIERHIGDDHLIAGSDPESHIGKVQRRRSRIDQDSVIFREEPGELILVGSELSLTSPV